MKDTLIIKRIRERHLALWKATQQKRFDVQFTNAVQKKLGKRA